MAQLGSPDPSLVFILGVFTCNGESALGKSNTDLLATGRQLATLGWNFADCFTQQLGI